MKYAQAMVAFLALSASASGQSITAQQLQSCSHGVGSECPVYGDHMNMGIAGYWTIDGCPPDKPHRVYAGDPNAPRGCTMAICMPKLSCVDENHCWLVANNDCNICTEPPDIAMCLSDSDLAAAIKRGTLGLTPTTDQP